MCIIESEALPSLIVLLIMYIYTVFFNLGILRHSTIYFLKVSEKLILGAMTAEESDKTYFNGIVFFIYSRSISLLN